MVVPELSEKAFRHFFEAHHVELARLASLLTGERAAADEVAAEALAEVRLGWGNCANPLVAARKALVAMAREWDRKQGRLVRNAQPQPRPDVRAALRQLSYRRRVCVVLRYAFGLSDEEIAAALGLPLVFTRRLTVQGAEHLAALLIGSPAHQRTPERELTTALARAGSVPAGGLPVEDCPVGHGRHRRETH